MSDEQTQLERIRQWFGVYDEAPKFDASVQTLLNLRLPEAAVREIVSGIWREAYEHAADDYY